MNVIKGTWASRLIRTSDGAAYRYRYRFCLCGGQQEYGINYFEMFAPIIQRGTIQLMLKFILTQNQATPRVIDYINAFPQAIIDTDISVEIPTMLGSKTKSDQVLKLKKSLYM